MKDVFEISRIMNIMKLQQHILSYAMNGIQIKTAVYCSRKLNTVQGKRFGGLGLVGTNGNQQFEGDT